MASVAIPMVAGFAAQKLATDVLGVDPKMAAILGMAAGGGAGAWASGGGSFGSLFGNTAGSAAAGQGASTIGQNMFGQTAGMAGMSPKVGGGLLSAAGTTGGAVPASLGYDAMASMTPGMDMFAGSAVNPHAGLAPNAFTQTFGSGMPNYAAQSGAAMQNPEAAMMAARYNAGQQGYSGYSNPYLGPNVGNADAPARLAQYSDVDLMGGQGYQMNPQMNLQMPDMSGPQMNPQMNTQMPSFAPSQYDQMASMYPGMDDPSLYMNTSATTTPLPNRPEIPSQNYNPINPNYQADDDMYTAQLFRDGNTVSGSSVANDSTSWNVADDLDYAELGGGGDSISTDYEYRKYLADKTLSEKGLSYSDMAATNPTQGQMIPESAKNWNPSTPEYDAYARASHGMDEYAMNDPYNFRPESQANDPYNFRPESQSVAESQAVANTQPNPAETGGKVSDWINQSGTTRADRMQREAAIRQSEVIKESLDDLIDGPEKTSWWDKAENQQFLMQAASILLSDDIEEQQVSSGGGGGGGAPSPGVYSGGSSPAPKVVFGMGGYNGQGQQGYNPREIM